LACLRESFSEGKRAGASHYIFKHPPLFPALAIIYWQIAEVHFAFQELSSQFQGYAGMAQIRSFASAREVSNLGQGVLFYLNRFLPEFKSPLIPKS
jgi:hypothetical protein